MRAPLDARDRCRVIVEARNVVVERPQIPDLHVRVVTSRRKHECSQGVPRDHVYISRVSLEGDLCLVTVSSVIHPNLLHTYNHWISNIVVAPSCYDSPRWFAIDANHNTSTAPLAHVTLNLEHAYVGDAGLVPYWC